MNVRIVPSGSFAVDGRKKEILEAHLGTCVGVSLVDTEAEVGGLLHLLLPEPPGATIAFSPFAYATTGLPRFIDRLIESGAKRSKLRGAIGGGGLVGEVDERDLWLDIGGKTAETVKDILRENGIRVDEVETGGYFSTRMGLSLDDLTTNIEPLVSAGSLREKEITRPTEEDLERAIEGVRPIPQIALKIIRMLREGDYDIDDVAMEVRQDQVIAARVLRLANSALVGAGKVIDSIDRGLIMLGEKHLLPLVLSATAEMLFGDMRPGGYSLCKGGVFHHALAAAMTAHEISVFTGRCQPDIAYTAGLLHDIGKIVLDQYVSRSAPFFYRSIENERVDLCSLEKDRFGIDHQETGGLLAKKWGLPPVLADCIQYHHGPEKSEVDRELVSIVRLADLLAARFKVGHQLDRPGVELLEETLSNIGLKREDFSIIVDKIPRSVFESSLLAT